MAKKSSKKSRLAPTAETQWSFSIGEDTPEETSSDKISIEDNRPAIS
jgi:hypothetical protein